MSDIVLRVPRLSFLDMNRILVFARSGRADREGPYATCHCVCLPPAIPAITSGAIRRRGVDAPVGMVRHEVAGRARRHSQIDYMVSFTLPRFCDQLRVCARKRALSRAPRVDGEAGHHHPRALPYRSAPARYPSHRTRGRNPLDEVSQPRLLPGCRRNGHAILTSSPDPEILEFLRYDFAGLTARYGGVVATTFKGSSYPRRYKSCARNRRTAGRPSSHSICRVP